MKLTKTLCTMLCVLLAFGAAAALSSCAKKGAALKGVEAEAGPLGKYKEPLKVTWGHASSSVQQFKNGDTYENNIWSRKFRDALNVDLQVGFTADGASGAYTNRLNLGLAAGDLPDIVRIDNYRVFADGARAGYFADLSQIYDKYAGDFMSMVKQKYPSMFKYASIDGKLYGVPPLNDNRQFASLLWIRDDWLKKLNLKPPTTIEELVEVARAFTFGDPDGNGKNDTYGLALNNLLVTNNFGHLHGIFSAFGVPAYTHIQYYKKDGKTTYAYLEPGTKDALALIQSMYKEGLIDPEFTVKDVNKIAEDIASGRVGMSYGLQWGTWWPWNALYSAKGVIAHPYAIPVKQGITPKIGYESNMSGGEITVISAKHANPEALVKMFNLYETVVNPWMSDETYAAYDADEQWRFAPTWINEPQETNYQPILQKAFESGSTDGLPTNLTSRYNQIKDFAEGRNKTTDAYGLWGQYALDGAMAVIMNQYVPKGYLVESILGADWPESLIANQATLQAMTEQAFTEIITGAPLSRYDQFVEEWKRAGGEQVLKEMDALYK